MIKRKIRKGACQPDTHFPSRKSYGKMFLMKKREAEEFSSVILGSVPDGIVTTDNDGRITFFFARLCDQGYHLTMCKGVIQYPDEGA
jgi:hypothetical protein